MPGWFSHLSAFGTWLRADQLTLIAASCVTALSLIPAFALRNSKPAPDSRPRLFSSSNLKRFLPAVAIWGVVTGSFSPFANVFLSARLHLPLHRVGTVFSLSQLFQVAAVLCAPILFRRMGVSKGVFAALIATAGCFVLLALCSRSLPASTVYIALSGAQCMSEPGIYSMLMGIVPEELRAGASASMALVLAVSQMIATGAAGWAFTNLGYPRTLGIIALIAVCAGILFNTMVQAPAQTLIPSGAESQAD